MRLWLTAVVSVAAVVGLGYVHPFGDPRAEPAKGLSTLLQGSSMPANTRQVLIAKCADCHSNETRWPVYTRIAPGSWLIERDIVEGRKKMNLSAWAEMPADTQEIIIGKILHEAKNGEMPPSQYRLLHWQTKLTLQDMAALMLLDKGASPKMTLCTAGDPVRGRAVYEKRCTGCHGSGGHREGPPLTVVFGKKAGIVAGFNYSTGLKNSGITWDETTLEKWLTDPDTVVPDNKMDFHLPKAQERSDVIAYFRSMR